jgi:hypothetical protein
MRRKGFCFPTFEFCPAARQSKTFFDFHPIDSKASHRRQHRKLRHQSAESPLFIEAIKSLDFPSSRQGDTITSQCWGADDVDDCDGLPSEGENHDQSSKDRRP